MNTDTFIPMINEKIKESNNILLLLFIIYFIFYLILIRDIIKKYY